MTNTPEIDHRFSQTKGIMFDIDGCLMLSDGPGGYEGQALPGAIEAVQAVKDAGLEVVVFTNGSMQPPEAIAENMRSMGFDITDDEVFTPGRVAAAVLKKHHGDAPVLAFGGDGIQLPMQQQDVNVVDPTELFESGIDQDIAGVVIGWDTNFGQQKIQLAAEAIKRGAKLYCTSIATHFAASHRMNVGISGFITMGLVHVTGVDYELVGKPSESAMESISTAMGSAQQELIIVGDALDAEVGMAVQAGAIGVLTTTGVTSRSEAETAKDSMKPDYIVDSMYEFMDLFRQYFPVEEKVS